MIAAIVDCLVGGLAHGRWRRWDDVIDAAAGALNFHRRQVAGQLEGMVQDNIVEVETRWAGGRNRRFVRLAQRQSH